MPKSKISIFKIVFLIPLVFFLNCTKINAQSHSLDSLKQIINSKVHDTTKLKAIGFLLVNLPNSSKEYSYYNEKFKNTAIHAIQNNNRNGEIKEKSYDALGVYYVGKAYQSMQSDYLLTIKNLNKGLEYFSDKYFISDKYIPARGNVLISLGVMHNKIGNTEQSINNYFEGLRTFKNLKNKSYVSYGYQSIANLYNEQRKYKQALNYYIKAYDVYYKKDDLSYQDNIQKVLLFISIGKIYQELNNCILSDSYLNKGLTLALKLNDKDVLSEIYFNLGRNEEKCRQDNSKALLEYQKSYTNSSLPENNTNSLIAIGSVLLKQQKYSEAEQYLVKGLDFAKKINHLEFQKQALENLYKVYKQRKQYEKALETSEFYAQIKDSIKKEQNDNTLTKKQLQYEYEAKQSELKLEQERKLNTITLDNQKKNAIKNNLLIGLSAVLLLLAVGSYFVYKNSKQKQAIARFEKNALNQKLLLSQMNPHFIFNSIDNIQSLIYNKQDKEAVNYLTKFSKLTRQILENSTENYISLEEELTMIDNYLIIQQLLYSNKFDFKVEVDPEIVTETILFPPMLTQPFIENAIKHGLKNKTEKGQINIRFSLIDGKLLFEITDNGTGFTAEGKINSNKSLAIKITKERLATLTNSGNFEVHTENLMDADKNPIGAKVSFGIPYIYEN